MVTKIISVIFLNKLFNQNYKGAIIMAIDKINNDSIDSNLEKKIYGDINSASYGTRAFKIALYLDKENEKLIEKQNIK